MKYFIILLFALVLSFSAQAQNKPYNQWSADLAVGVHGSDAPFTEGYSQGGMNFPQASLGVRYMFNNKFGARASLGYLTMSEAEASEPFSSTYLRGSLEGVANLGNLLRLLNSESRFTVLLHAGGGLSRLNFDQVPDNPDRSDNLIHLMAGLTPEYKVTDRIALFADFSFSGHLAQSYTWDGQSTLEEVEGASDGSIWTAGIGVSFSFGGSRERADFYPSSGGGNPCY